jgi:hypothetical protein
VSARVQDPDSFRLWLNVTDIADACRDDGAGSRVASTSGASVVMTFGTSRWPPRQAFLIVRQRLPDAT